MNQTIENYLKGIYTLSKQSPSGVATTALAEKMETKASSVTDMLKKLDEKGLVRHAPYKGAVLTQKGKKIAIEVVRKHRLWEVFLVEKLRFGWDEVHTIAEQLEHIDSAELIVRLDEFLGFPRYDPHGDPIPDVNGHISDNRKAFSLSEAAVGTKVIIAGVKESSDNFLRYLESVALTLNTTMKIADRFAFDNSVRLKVKNREIIVSSTVAENLLVKKGK
ncbi:MAG: metal-dependent transcriptional regulator [Crocinitomicaceae bacterium]|nr:metal-dependent transcriptional regulator [Crocinitomicaceae bacterium]